jgi:acyl-CoA reductase-like NAD-dependent aldehyde dehydrogenase
VQTKLFIDGQLTDGLAGRVIDVIKPADGSLLAQVAEAGSEDIDRAVEAAQRAYRGWAARPAAERGRLLIALAGLIEANAAELAELESRDTGHPIRDTMGLDVPRTAAACYKRVSPGSPFGGVGQSGYGREMGFAAMAEYTTPKSVWVNVDATLPDWYAS